MTVQSIAHSYWRLIKAGRKTFDSLSEEAKGKYPAMKDQVRYLAKCDVRDGVITVEEYENYTGEEYVALEDSVEAE